MQLAERDRQLLGEPRPVTVARFQEFPGWLEAWGTAARDEDSMTGTSGSTQETGTTPEEQIANGIEQLEANVRGGQLVVASTAVSMRTVWDWSASKSRPSGRATKGVFLTTSTFSREATNCAAEVKDKKIVLIDGSRLTRLMIDAGVGVSVRETYRVHRLDEDFFAEFEEE